MISYSLIKRTLFPNDTPGFAAKWHTKSNASKSNHNNINYVDFCIY